MCVGVIIVHSKSQIEVGIFLLAIQGSVVYNPSPAQEDSGLPRRGAAGLVEPLSQTTEEQASAARDLA
jgi:hypothetical protein